MAEDGHPISKRAWYALMAVALVVSVAAGVAEGERDLAFGLAIFFLLIILPLRLPFELALLLLATGWLPFEDIFGSGLDRALLPGLGGLNVSGFRLLGATGGLVIALFLVRRKLLARSLPGWAKAALAVYCLGLLWATATLAWAPDALEGLRGVFKLAFPLLCAAVIFADPRDLGPEKLVRKVATVLAAALVAASIWGFIGLINRDLLHRSEQGEIADWFGWAGAGSYGFFVGFVALLWLSLWEHGLSRRGWMIALLGFVQVPISLKRMVVGATGFAVSAMHLIGGRHRLLFPIGAIAAVALLLYFPPLVSRNVYESNAPADGGPAPAGGSKRPSAKETITEATKRPTQVIKFEGREYLWRMAWNEVKQDNRWVAGLGMNAWSTRERANFQSFPQLHGEYVRLVYETGVIGLALIFTPFFIYGLGLVVVCFRTPSRTLRRATAAAAVGTSVLYVLTWVTDNTLDYYLIGAYAWTVLALPLIAARMNPDEDLALEKSPRDDQVAAAA